MANIKSVKAVTKKRGRPPGHTAIKSDAVAVVRDLKKWSQQEMATELKCSMSSVAGFERRGVLPSHGPLLERFKQVAKSVGVEVPS